MNDLIVIGASGFSGKRLCNILRQRDIPFDALVRETSDTGRVGMFADKLVRGDASDPDDLARALKGYQRCIHIPDLSAVRDAEAYNISGPSAMTYRSMMQQIAVAAGRKTKFVSVPVRPVCFTARMMEKLHRPFPFRSEQFLRLVENKNVDHTEAAADFAFSPRSFAEGLRAGYFAGKH